MLNRSRKQERERLPLVGAHFCHFYPFSDHHFSLRDLSISSRAHNCFPPCSIIGSWCVIHAWCRIGEWDYFIDFHVFYFPPYILAVWLSLLAECKQYISGASRVAHWNVCWNRYNHDTFVLWGMIIHLWWDGSPQKNKPRLNPTRQILSFNSSLTDSQQTISRYLTNNQQTLQHNFQLR